MAEPTQFRHYLICKGEDGGNIETVRSSEQAGVLAFDSHRLQFVHCHIMLEPLKKLSALKKRAEKLSAFGHPLLARVLEHGDDDGSFFYITENVDGETLRAYLSRQPQLPVWLAGRLADFALAAFRALAVCGDYVPRQPLEALRVVKSGPRYLTLRLADYRLSESAGGRGGRKRQLKDSFEKQAQLLCVYFKHQAAREEVSGDPLLVTAEFRKVLEDMLLVCGPNAAQDIPELRKKLLSVMPEPPEGDLDSKYKPWTLIGPLIGSFQEVARSLSQTVRMQSQKPDALRPYAMWARLMRNGQNVIVDQIPPARLAGSAPGDALREARSLPKTGKFPNILPLVFVEEKDGLLCAAEAAVEGCTLYELLEQRGALEAAEALMVLRGVDIALGQLEKAGRAMRRLRLEDVFLFTGAGADHQPGPDMMHKPLHAWPGFSIVLRGHPTLDAMAGRGTDPGMLLPVDTGSVESPWHGGWLAALGTFITGSVDQDGAARGMAKMEPVVRLLDKEIAAAWKGPASPRADFLRKFAELLPREEAAEEKKKALESDQLRGSTLPRNESTESARPPLLKISESAPSITPLLPLPTVPPPDEETEEVPAIGFAEALMNPHASGAATVEGKKSLRQPVMESSWTEFRQSRSSGFRLVIFAVLSFVAAAVLAHLQGRALWQKRSAPLVITVPREQILPPVIITKEPPEPKLPPPVTPLLGEVKVEPAPKQPEIKPVISPDRLRQLRLSGAPLPAELRPGIEEAAAGGSTEAMIILGNALLRGDGGSANEQAAFTWFDKAVHAGDLSALVSLAGCYLQGWGTPPDFDHAVSLLTRAVNGGDPSAKDLLGVCYARGLGVARDDEKAFQLMQQASAAGVPSAYANLGSMYLRGQGVASNAAKATELFREGAKLGHPESMLLYARSLESGLGVPPNAKEAAQWYEKAARLGNIEAADWCSQQGLKL